MATCLVFAFASNWPQRGVGLGDATVSVAKAM